MIKSLLVITASLSLAYHSPAVAKDLTLTTYNIHSGIPGGHSNATYIPASSDLRNVADVLTTAGPHIIALQEVRNQWRPPGKTNQAPDMARELATLLKMNYAFASTLMATAGYPENRAYTQWGTADTITSNGSSLGNFGNAILSRYPIAPPQTIKLPSIASDDTTGKPDEPRNAIRVEIGDIPGLGPVVVYGTHLQHNNGKTREAQMRHLLEVARRDSTSATVFLMGDFNHHPHKGEPDLLGMAKQAGFHDMAAKYAAETKTSPAPTMPSKTNPIRIDYIFCSKPLKVKNVTVLKTDVSDHYPLTITVEP